MGGNAVGIAVGSALELIAREGADALYRGDLGRAFEQEISTNHGYVTLADLSAYEAAVRKPLALQSRGFNPGAMNVAGCDNRGKLHALADNRRHGAQYVSGNG